MSRPKSVPVVFLALFVAVAALAFGDQSPDAEIPTQGALAYVANAGSNHVQVVDLESGKTVRKIYAGTTPWRLVVSPDQCRLWVQHWYSATTAVVDLESHEIVRVVPTRGPGIFSPSGERFLSFSWPSSKLTELDASTFEEVAERRIEVREVYDFAVTPNGDFLYLAQFNPMAKSAKRVYAYALSLPWNNGEVDQLTPITLRTGRSPLEVRALEHHPFLLTADSETNGLSLFNERRDGRAVPSCPAPRTVLLSPDETGMVAVCWRGQGARTSEVVRYVTDFKERPWPTLERRNSLTVEGALVAGTFSPAGDRLYLVDRSGSRLLEVDPETLDVQRTFPTGDEPVDVVVVPATPEVRARLAGGESQARRIATRAITKLRAYSAPFVDLSWKEIAVGEKEADEEEARPKAELHVKGPGWLRSESASGRIRLARGGNTVSVDETGRFWVTPRQELVSVLFSLPNLSVDEALRHLAGDVPGSPFLRSGLAIDVAEEVEQEGKHLYVIGAPIEGARTSQLWVDASSGQPLNLVEQVPTFRPRDGHGGSTFGGIVETRFFDFREHDGGRRMPTRLQRMVDGLAMPEVRLEDVRFDRGLPEETFSLVRLGGASASPELIRPVAAEQAPDGPGLAAPIVVDEPLSKVWQPHAPYNSNPPTSGPRMFEMADWGVHEIPVPLELQVRNLEDGGVLVQYNCPGGCPELVKELERIVKSRDQVILAPYPLMKAKIALTSWGRLETLDELEEDRIVRFIEAYAGKDLERPDTPGTSRY